ncbi:hypothetical protein ACHHY8_02385 [Enterobacter cloacae complex sp. 2024EL-00215]|uniref:hypothetical protein n=1 Tax=unclassified Enterobacter cloacae complex TaxID=2757714 RepID=UPI003753AA5C
MDESRKQFERWISSLPMCSAERHRIDNDRYRFNTTEVAWKAWQASRAAIEIELPEGELVYSTATDTYGEDGCLMLPVETIARVLDDAGIKVKE